MSKELDSKLANALSLLKEFLLRPAILAQLTDDGKRIAHDEIAKFENTLISRVQARKLHERQQEVQKKIQAECPHVAGSLGEMQDIYGRTSIVWHSLRSKKNEFEIEERVIGICGTCGRKFFPEDEDYAFWRKKPCFNRLSASGYGVGEEVDEPIPEDQFVAYFAPDGWGEKKEPLTEKDFLDLSVDELEKRSTFEIRKVMEYVRAERKKAKEVEDAPAA